MCAFKIEECINRSSLWLEQIQNKQDGGWGQFQGSGSNILNTAETIMALIEAGCHKAGSDVIQNGAKFLVNQQLNKSNHNIPENYGSWPRIVSKDNTLFYIPDTVRTSIALLALITAGKSVNDEPIILGVKWLVNMKNNSNGGWGYKIKSDSRLFPTCIALKALIEIYNAGDNRLLNTIIQGIKHLISYKNSDDSFGKDPELISSHTLCVINTLSLVKGQDFPNCENLVKDAIDWIRQDMNRVTNWGTEQIIIGDSPNSPFNYTYSHINPAIYLAIIGRLVSSQDDISREALIVVADNMDISTKGFCAKRSVSWATANTMIGLAQFKNKVQEFPERKQTPTSLGGKQILLGVLLLFIVISGVLAFMDKLSITYASFSFVIILAALLVYGFISEKTFLELNRSNKEIIEKVAKQKDDKS